MIEKLKGNIPQEVYEQLNDTCKKFNITNELRLIHFISQCAHESNNFKTTKENLNYSETGLLKTFIKYFDSDSAKLYAHNPEKIANRVYANRMGNGNEESGDGYKYCGRGYIQLTGKDNYAEFDKLVDDNILVTPTLVATKYPLMSAAFFFNKNNLWSICDLPLIDKDKKDVTNGVITKLTKRINGGVNGLIERIKLFNKYYKIIHG